MVKSETRRDAKTLSCLKSETETSLFCLKCENLRFRAIQCILIFSQNPESESLSWNAEILRLAQIFPRPDIFQRPFYSLSSTTVF